MLGVIASAALIFASFFGAYTYASSTRAASSSSSETASSELAASETLDSSAASAASSDAAGTSASSESSASASTSSSSGASSSSVKTETPNKRGIDVSETQGEINWEAVAADGIEFVFIRVGYRGSSEGKIYADETYQANFAGARKAGLECGAYFYSQALTPEEAKEEAEYMLDALGDMKLEYPVVFDYEIIGPNMFSRIANISSEDATKNALAFCETIEEAGYDAMIYGNMYDLGHLNLDELKWPIWYAEYNEQASYTGEYDIWQYSCTGIVSGINMEVDLNLDMRTVEGAKTSRDRASSSASSSSAASSASGAASSAASSTNEASASTTSSASEASASAASTSSSVSSESSAASSGSTESSSSDTETSSSAA